MTLQSNIRGRLKAEAAFDLLVADLDASEVQAAMRTLRSLADKIDAPVPAAASEMSHQEALTFRAQICHYRGHEGERWKDVPREYIARIADLGLELQRYLRSPLGQSHNE